MDGARATAEQTVARFDGWCWRRRTLKVLVGVGAGGGDRDEARRVDGDVLPDPALEARHASVDPRDIGLAAAITPAHDAGLDANVAIRQFLHRHEWPANISLR